VTIIPTPSVPPDLHCTMPRQLPQTVLSLACSFAIGPVSGWFVLVGFQAAPVRALRPARGNV